MLLIKRRLGALYLINCFFFTLEGERKGVPLQLTTDQLDTTRSYTLLLKLHR